MNIIDRGNDLNPEYSFQERPRTARGISVGSNRARVPSVEQQSSLFKNFSVPPPIRHIPYNLSVTSTPNQFLAENFWRRYLLIVNVGSSVIWVAFNIAVGDDGTNGIPIYPNQTFELKDGTVSSASFVCPGSNSNIRILEGLIQQDA